MLYHLRLCEPLNINGAKSGNDLFNKLRSYFIEIVQYRYYNRSTVTLNTLCGNIMIEDHSCAVSYLLIYLCTYIL